uniref:Uncharacterized protein n=1 Tax=viral metagenome TaxID=1070528 RepID=A0A6C0JVT5_9ZZZZ
MLPLGVLLFVIVLLIVLRFTVFKKKSPPKTSNTQPTTTTSNTQPTTTTSNTQPTTTTSNTQPSTSKLIITENGSTKTENYRIRGREGYMINHDVRKCHQSEPEGWCSEIGYAVETNGMAFIYDKRLGPNPQNTVSVCNEDGLCTETPQKCPGEDGYDCTYIEKYNEEGTLISISNKKGEELLDKMAVDCWAGEWEGWTVLNDNVGKFEYRDGKILFKEDIPSREIKAGDELTLSIAVTHFSPTLYFVMLFTLMKRAGEPKPQTIQLAVRGAKEGFRRKWIQEPTTLYNNSTNKMTTSNANSTNQLITSNANSTNQLITSNANSTPWLLEPGQYKLSYYSNASNNTWCSVQTNNGKLRCGAEEDTVQRFTFSKQGDGYKIALGNSPCSTFPSIPGAGEEPVSSGFTKCRSYPYDPDSDLYKVINYAPGNKRFKLLNASQNKYCRMVNDEGLSYTNYLRCDQDSVENGDTFRHS